MFLLGKGGCGIQEEGKEEELNTGCLVDEG